MSANQPEAQPRWLAAHRRWLTVHRRPVIGGAVAAWAAAMLATVVIVIRHDLAFFGPVGGSYVLAVGSFAVTGAIIGWYRPGHLLALLFLLVGMLTPLANLQIALALGPLAAHPLGLRAGLVAVAVGITTMVLPLLALVILLFPDGRLPSARWRWMPWMVVLVSVVGAAAAFSAGGWGGDVDGAIIGPPFGGAAVRVAEVLSPVYFVLLIPLIILSGVAAALRFRRSCTVTRQQLKWLALSALLLSLILIWVAITVGASATGAGAPAAIVLSAGVALLPVSVTVAIVRHRLYDIDLVLSRALVFATLAAFITALYAVTVVGVGSLIGDASNLLLKIGATALVAVVFEPVRARVQRWANRVVYGRRATPYQVLTTLVDELPTAEASVDQLEGLAALLADGTGAGHATIWVQLDGVLRAAACAPQHDPAEHPAAVCTAGGRVDVDGVTHIEPVLLDGDLLGALSFERGRDDPVTPQDRALLSQMAGQAALVLGNARLRERLRLRVEAVRESRQRLVAAQDEARRKLERDLHDGAQQELVALKVKLGLARSIAAKEDAGPQVTEIIGELSAVADAAVEALRDLARGLYPPLLEAEGLERALITQLDRALLPVEFRATALGRYGRQIEATVYFCVLEAVRHAVTRAGASHLRLVLEDHGDRLEFLVSHDGDDTAVEQAPHRAWGTNMADRLDALGGSLAIESGADSGVEVTGVIPVVGQGTPDRPDALAVV